MKYRFGLILITLVFVACKNDTPTQTQPVLLGAPSRVSASVIDSATIHVHWMRASNDNMADTVIVSAQGAIVGHATVLSPDTSVNVRGLTTGIQYSIVVKSHDNAGTLVMITIPVMMKPATNLQVVALGSSSIAIKWTRDLHDDAPDTLVVVNATGIVISKIPVAAPSSQNVATGLSTGVKYTFTVHNAGGISQPISWMTATRFGPVNIYEFNATGPSGLYLQAGSAVSMTQVNVGRIDFFLDEDQSSPSGLMLRGAQMFDATWRHSYINNDQVYATNGSSSALDAAYCSSDFSAFMNAVASGAGSNYGNEFAISVTGSSSRILTVETADGNLTRIEMVPNGTGYVRGNGNQRYITVNISYNPSANQPYASRPRVHRGAELPKTIF